MSTDRFTWTSESDACLLQIVRETAEEHNLSLPLLCDRLMDVKWTIVTARVKRCLPNIMSNDVHLTDSQCLSRYYTLVGQSSATTFNPSIATDDSTVTSIAHLGVLSLLKTVHEYVLNNALSLPVDVSLVDWSLIGDTLNRKGRAIKYASYKQRFLRIRDDWSMGKRRDLPDDIIMFINDTGILQQPLVTFTSPGLPTLPQNDMLAFLESLSRHISDNPSLSLPVDVSLVDWHNVTCNLAGSLHSITPKHLYYKQLFTRLRNKWNMPKQIGIPAYLITFGEKTGIFQPISYKACASHGNDLFDFLTAVYTHVSNNPSLSIPVDVGRVDWSQISAVSTTTIHEPSYYRQRFIRLRSEWNKGPQRNMSPQVVAFIRETGIFRPHLSKLHIEKDIVVQQAGRLATLSRHAKKTKNDTIRFLEVLRKHMKMIAQASNEEQTKPFNPYTADWQFVVSQFEEDMLNIRSNKILSVVQCVEIVYSINHTPQSTKQPYISRYAKERGISFHSGDSRHNTHRRYDTYRNFIVFLLKSLIAYMQYWHMTHMNALDLSWSNWCDWYETLPWHDAPDLSILQLGLFSSFFSSTTSSYPSIGFCLYEMMHFVGTYKRLYGTTHKSSNARPAWDLIEAHDLFGFGFHLAKHTHVRQFDDIASDYNDDQLHEADVPTDDDSDEYDAHLDETRNVSSNEEMVIDVNKHSSVETAVSYSNFHEWLPPPTRTTRPAASKKRPRSQIIAEEMPPLLSSLTTPPSVVELLPLIPPVPKRIAPLLPSSFHTNETIPVQPAIGVVVTEPIQQETRLTSTIPSPSSPNYWSPARLAESLFIRGGITKK